MMKLIIGGSGSGKSAYAEECIAVLSEEKKKYYIATMQVFDEEGKKKINRHRQLRSGKGFMTIEQPRSIPEVLGKMEEGEKTALLECMSNLVANEMFAGVIPKSKETVIDKIAIEIELVKAKLMHLVIVSNNVFEDGIAYDDSTMEYIKALGSINKRLAALADEVVEVVAGIPVIIKKGSEFGR